MGRTRSNTDSEALSSLEAGELSEPGASCVPRVSTTTPCPWGGTALVTTGEDCRPVWARNHLPGDTLRPTEVSRLSRAPGLASGWTGPLTAPSSFMLEGRTGPGTEELVDAGLGAARHKCHWAEPHEPFLPFLTEARRTGSLPLPRGCHRPPPVQAQGGRLSRSSVPHWPHPQEESEQRRGGHASASPVEPQVPVAEMPRPPEERLRPAAH